MVEVLHCGGELEADSLEVACENLPPLRNVQHENPDKVVNSKMFGDLTAFDSELTLDTAAAMAAANERKNSSPRQRIRHAQRDRIQDSNN